MDGIIIIDKEKEYTSNDVVAIVKKITQEKVGHTGTLDPNATGVLPLLVGQATKFSKYLMQHDKVYEATLKLGIRTDTADIWGEIIEEKTSKELIQKEQIEKVLTSFIGKRKQIPPMYSAIKVNGKKLYEYARKKQEVTLESREVEIYQILLQNWKQEENEITFRVSCSKGTYIRTLCEEIATALGTIGTMSALRRIQVGEFTLEKAVCISQIKEDTQAKKHLEESCISLEDILKRFPSITVSQHEIPLLLNGVKIEKAVADGVYQVQKETGEPIGTAIVQKGKVKRDIMIAS